jgi:hypothetical protein
MAYPGMMRSIAVFIKHNGVLAPCRAYPQPEGALWICGNCSTPIIRASYGVLNGRCRCSCGDEVEVLVDGYPVDLKKESLLAPGRSPEDPIPQSAEEATDEDFLRGIHIVPDLAPEED